MGKSRRSSDSESSVPSKTQGLDSSDAQDMPLDTSTRALSASHSSLPSEHSRTTPSKSYALDSPVTPSTPLDISSSTWSQSPLPSPQDSPFTPQHRNSSFSLQQGSPFPSPMTPHPPSSGRTSPSGWSLTSGRSSVWGVGSEQVTTHVGGQVTDMAFQYCVTILEQSERSKWYINLCDPSCPNSTKVQE